MLLHGHYYADALWRDKEATIIHSRGAYVSHRAHHVTICNSCTMTWGAAPRGRAATLVMGELDLELGVLIVTTLALLHDPGHVVLTLQYT